MFVDFVLITFETADRVLMFAPTVPRSLAIVAMAAVMRASSACRQQL